jgi:hypothetical protein
VAFFLLFAQRFLGFSDALEVSERVNGASLRLYVRIGFLEVVDDLKEAEYRNGAAAY